jgi:ABC-type uncharacterized transport system substrate-binding protein
VSTRLSLTQLLACASSLVTFSALLAQPAEAHPHVFIDNTVSFVFAGDKIIGFRENWVFDDVFSDELLGEFDANHDKSFDAAESKKVGETVLPNVKQFHYFTYVWVDKKDLGEIPPSDFKATATKGIVTFDFLVKLPKPIDPKTESLALEVYDHEFYVEVDLHKTEPVRFLNMQGVNCTSSIHDDASRAYFGGFVNPQEIKLACK